MPTPTRTHPHTHTPQVVSAYLLAHVSPFKELAAARGPAAASDVMVQLLEASPVLTLGGPPKLPDVLEGVVVPPPGGGGSSPPLPGAGRRRPSPAKQREGGGGVGGEEGKGEDLSTVVYRRGKVYAACTVRCVACCFVCV